MKTALFPALLIALLPWTGCSADDGSAGTPGLTYHRDAVAVLDRYCTTCHQAGGIAPFPLTDYPSVQRLAPLIKSAVSSGSMPPWMPSDKGLPLRYSRAMRPQDRDLLLSWIDAGTPEGDGQQAARRDIPAAETVPPPRPDLVVDAGVTYQPNQNLSDDYRCFIADPGLTEDSFFAAGTIVPGNGGIVHHVIVYEVPERDAAKVRQQDQDEVGPGYSCFGGPGNVSASQTVLVWAPGSVPMRAPEGLAVKLSKGSLLIIQVHYNLQNYHGTGDKTTVQLERAAARPAQIAMLVPVADPANLHIAAGNRSALQVINVPLWVATALFQSQTLKIYGNVPHMHQLATRITTRLMNGPVLVDVPRWDFHWQQYYQFQQPIEVKASDTLSVECEYDNSMEHQPLVNGQRQQPRDVAWGEKTTDEMCLSYMQVGLKPETAL